jgi:hypothetical protein
VEPNEEVTSDPLLVTHTDEDLVPDWLKPIEEEPETIETITTQIPSDTQISSAADDYVPPVILNP